jgi:hypothetical protein
LAVALLDIAALGFKEVEALGAHGTDLASGVR